MLVFGNICLDLGEVGEQKVLRKSHDRSGKVVLSVKICPILI